MVIPQILHDDEEKESVQMTALDFITGMVSFVQVALTGCVGLIIVIICWDDIRLRCFSFSTNCSRRVTCVLKDNTNPCSFTGNLL